MHRTFCEKVVIRHDPHVQALQLLWCSKHIRGESSQEFVYLGYYTLNLNFWLFYESNVIELF